MTATFAGARQFNVDISSWDTGKVVSTPLMFYAATQFVSIMRQFLSKISGRLYVKEKLYRLRSLSFLTTIAGRPSTFTVALTNHADAQAANALPITWSFFVAEPTDRQVEHAECSRRRAG